MGGGVGVGGGVSFTGSSLASASSRTASGKQACASFSISANSSSSSLGYLRESFGISSCDEALSFLTSSFASVGLGDDDRGCVRGGHSGRHDLCGNQPVS